MQSVMPSVSLPQLLTEQSANLDCANSLQTVHGVSGQIQTHVAWLMHNVMPRVGLP